MNRLAEELVRGILGEEMAPRKKVIGMFGGGFKPPTIGHLEVVQKALSDYPEMDKMIIYVGSGERDSIDQKESVAIWRIYQKYLPSKVEIQPSPEGKPPIGAVYSYAKNNPDKDILWFLGEREGNKDDFYDFLKRVRALNRGQEKGIYSNLQAKKIITPSTISGTKARKALLARNKEEFFSYLPDIPETEEIWNILSEAAGIMEDQDPINPNDQVLARKGAFIYFKGKKIYLKRRRLFVVKGEVEGRVTLEDQKGRQFWIMKHDMDNKWAKFNPIQVQLHERIAYDAETRMQTRYLMKQFLKNLGKKVESDTEGVLVNKKYELVYGFYPQKKGLGFMPFKVEGSTGPKDIVITVKYNPELLTKELYSELSAEIRNSVRHELEHLAQYRAEKGVRPGEDGVNQDDLPDVEYLTLDYEIPGHIQGLRTKAKAKKISLQQAIDDLFDSYEYDLTPEEEDFVRETWMNWLETNMPGVSLTKIKENVDREELKKGIKVEKEHTDNPKIAMKIALDHLAEDPKYYTKLATLGLEEDKMSSINLDQKKSTYSKEYLEILNRFPEALQREIIDERPKGDQADIDELKGWRLNKETPYDIPLNKLLKNPENLGAISRTPKEVVNKINSDWGVKVKPGTVYDQNPGRYFKYAKEFSGATAKPSIMINGIITWGVGRFIAALLRNDKTIKVWDIKDSVNEYLDQQDVQDLDKLADTELNPIDVDLSGNHFFDRLNDPRNRPEIDYLELEDFFTKLGDNREEFINFLNKYKSVVATDNQTNINIPFMKMANKAIAKTIMRKKNFQTPNVKVELEEEVPQDVIDSFDIQNTLVPEVWNGEELKPEIREKLLKIAQDFFESLELPKETKLKDIKLTGSLANYNWSKFSDFDLHLVLDFSDVDDDEEFVRNYFMAKKGIWNDAHDITIYNFPVEVYVENEGESHTASGLYSILNDEWIVVPKKQEVMIDKDDISTKAEDYISQTEEVQKLYDEEKYEEVISKVDKIKERLRNMRSSGLEKGGEYSVENLAFKILRRSDIIGRLNDLKANSYDTMMSINEDIDVESLNPNIISLTQYMGNNGLNLKPYPKVKFIKDDVKNAEDLLGKTAYYDPNAKLVVLYTLDRHPKDVLRSYAHELVHHHQNLNGTLNHSNTTNTNEDDALDVIEREAYENGNILFRNWEDSLKN